MNRRGIFFAILLVLAAAGILFYFFRSDSPRYQGRTLDDWLERLEGEDALAGNGVTWVDSPPTKTSQQLEAAKAIQTIGTNALPKLMADISATNSPLYELLEKTRRFVYEKILRRQVYMAAGPSPADETRWRAALGLEALGPGAQSAFPKLVLLFNRPNAGSDSSTKEAAFVLAGMGQPGIAVLTNSSRAPSGSWNYICAVWAVGLHPKKATNLSSWLLATARTNPASFGWPAEVWALGHIHSSPEIVIPVLTNLVNYSNTQVQNEAIQALGSYGKDATGAIPVLEAARSDSELKWFVDSALKKIRPDNK